MDQSLDTFSFLPPFDFEAAGNLLQSICSAVEYVVQSNVAQSNVAQLNVAQSNAAQSEYVVSSGV